ncbi:hypothetical protein [Erythrobacter sp. HKB08]|uniref:hypothetical protein n=1 Tax=Erythrobacter sp. HKB08 TaxID=2502843 RepID=UPI0010090C8A|nr:hypothetical protein [Erythrobacter sp. HKB08]
MKHVFVSLAVLGLVACGDTAEPAADSAADDVAETVAAADAERTAEFAAAEEDIRHFLLQEYPDMGELRYALALYDLDGDGAQEAIVHVVSPMLCGSGGCNTLVLTPAGPMWRKVGDISVSRTPITVLESETGGWKDLTVEIGGGGGVSGIAKLAFDGEAYPSNPTVAPAEMVDAGGEVLISEEPVFSVATPEEEPKDTPAE